MNALREQMDVHKCAQTQWVATPALVGPAID